MRSSTCCNWARATIGVVLMLVAVAASDGAAAQVLKQRLKPLKIKEIVGKDTVHVGDVETYRVVVNDSRDVEYRWMTADRSAFGNPVVHRFERPGTFEVIVTARNVVSTASDTLVITVLGPEPPPQPPVAEAKPAQSGREGVEPEPEGREKSGEAAAPEGSESQTEGSSGVAGDAVGFRGKEHLSPDAGGYTWVIATYFERPSAVALANTYRASGYRVGVITDEEGRGTRVFRVILGAFDSEQSALNAKQYLVNAGYKNVMLRELSRTG